VVHVQGKANMEMTTPKYNTALLLAVENGQTPLIELLVNKGNQPCSIGCNLLSLFVSLSTHIREGKRDGTVTENINSDTYVYTHSFCFTGFLLWSYSRLSWWRGTVVERRSLAGELSLSCARPAADG